MRKEDKIPQFRLERGGKVKFVEPIFGRVYDAKVLEIGSGGVKIMVKDWDEGQKQGTFVNRNGGGKIHKYNTTMIVRAEDLEIDPMELLKRIMTE